MTSWQFWIVSEKEITNWYNYFLDNPYNISQTLEWRHEEKMPYYYSSIVVRTFIVVVRICIAVIHLTHLY